MDVTKAPILDIPVNRSGTAAPTSQQSSSSSSPSRAVTATVDRFDVHPLNPAAALQILIAEVGTALQSTLQPSPTQTPAQTSRVLVEMFLNALTDANALSEDASHRLDGDRALVRVEIAFQSGMDEGVSAVAAWRDVPQAVVDVAKDTRTLVVNQVAEQPLSPSWVRPEWLGLVPTIQRYWRRRRAARRRLTDPDLRRFQGREIALSGDEPMTGEAGQAKSDGIVDRGDV